MPDPLAIVLPVRFNEAIRAADRRKVVLPDAYYGELQAATRSRAFTISGLASAVQIRGALDDLNEGLHSGMSFDDWKTKALARDWLLPESRLELIMRTHAQTAYLRGTYEQAEQVKARRPFLMYSAINDSRTRPAHRAMDGVIRAFDDSFWDDHYPPCGFNCRCSVITLTEEQATDRGGPTQGLSGEAMADPGWGSRPTDLGERIHEAAMRESLDAPPGLQRTIQDYLLGIDQEKIVQRVSDFLGEDYDRFAFTLGGFLRDYEGLIAEHEAVALRAYTDIYSDQINRFLRGKGGTNLGIEATVAAGEQAWSKLPAFEGDVYRGAQLEGFPNPKAFIEAHQPGEIVQYMGYTSTSTSVAFEGNVQYTIRSLSGRDVVGLSSHEMEDEVLFRPGTRFRVLSIDTSAFPIRIEMEELADQGVVVPKSNRFAVASPGLQARVNAEAMGVDEDLDRFMAEHDGMTPAEYALSQFPSAAMDVALYAPEMLAPKKD